MVTPRPTSSDPTPVPPDPAVDPSDQSENRPSHQDGRSRWHWLLLVPVVVPLLVFVYNDRTPYLFGFPRYYWMQLAFVLLGVVTTALVYKMTKRRGE